ncbi:MAG: glycosyltransferase family 4 protein [Acidimicrobiia bacterium]
MRLLYLTFDFPFPATSGGRQRSIAQLELLSSIVDELTVLSLSEDTVTDVEIASLRSLLSGRGAKVEVLPPAPHAVHIKRDPMQVVRTVFRRVVKREPYLFAKWWSPKTARAVREVAASGRWDVVYIDHLGMATHLQALRQAAPGARFVLEEHNVESDFFVQFAKEAPRWARPIARLEARVAQRAEVRVLRSMDAVVTISASDRDMLREMIAGGSTAARQPLVVDVLPQVVPNEPGVRHERRERPVLAYVGSLSWRPNRIGVSWFVTEVWPLVVAQVPAARLIIAGTGIGRGADGAPDDWKAPGVDVRGFVDDLGEIFASSFVLVAPTFGGSGVRMKLLEGFKVGLPIVTTADGASGLDIEDGRELVVADDPAATAAAIARLWREPDEATSLVRAATEYLRRAHGTESARATLASALGAPVDREGVSSGGR